MKHIKIHKNKIWLSKLARFNTISFKSIKMRGNNMKINYQKETDKVINKIKTESPKPTLLLHSCCAPCSSYVLEYLSPYFDITVFFYNPNIYPDNEFKKRLDEQTRLVSYFDKVNIINEGYDHNEFLSCIKSLEHEKEGGIRCFSCFELRLGKTAEIASKKDFNYFATTLSISPLKNCEKLNEIGFALSKKYGIKYLPADFKKKNGFKRSTELSKVFNLYRQNFCGCEFSNPNLK